MACRDICCSEICFLQYVLWLLGKEAQSPGYEELLPAKYAFVLHTKMLGLYGYVGKCCPAQSDFFFGVSSAFRRGQQSQESFHSRCQRSLWRGPVDTAF